MAEKVSELDVASFSCLQALQPPGRIIGSRVNSVDHTTIASLPSPPTATGILKGYDPLLNLVLDGCIEHVQG